MPTAEPLLLPRAIIFDMDGTLTQPIIDFSAIKRDIGLGDGPILEAIRHMNDVDRARAEAILFRHENDAATQSTLNAGCEALLRWLDQTGVATAVVTRNTRASVNTVFGLHGLNFDVCITREDGKYKPDPAPLQLACRRLNVDVADSWMVGDGNHDIEAAVATGMKSVWISHGIERSFEAEPWRVVRTLPELHEMLEGLAR